MKDVKGGDDTLKTTGSSLCRKMLERGDKWVVCKVADTSEEDATSNSRPRLVTKFDEGFYIRDVDQYWKYAVPINIKGGVMTQEEVGL